MLAALVAFYGYYLWPLVDRPDVYYIATGLLIVVLALRWLADAKTWAGHLACAVCVIEGAQHSACGAATWGQVATGVDLCRRALGADLYAASVSLALSGALAWGVKTWRR